MRYHSGHVLHATTGDTFPLEYVNSHQKVDLHRAAGNSSRETFFLQRHNFTSCTTKPRPLLEIERIYLIHRITTRLASEDQD